MAQKRYSVVCVDNAGTAPQSLVNLTGSTAVRPRVYEFDVGSVSTPADQASTVQLIRSTTTGTGSAATPAPLDAQEVAAVTTALITLSAEPTVTTSLFQVPLNQRASWRWVAAPDSEFIGVASANAGLALRRISSTATYTMTGVILFFE